MGTYTYTVTPVANPNYAYSAESYQAGMTIVARPVVLTAKELGTYTYGDVETLGALLAEDTQTWVTADFTAPEGCEPVAYTVVWNDDVASTSDVGTYTYTVTPVATPNYSYSAESYQAGMTIVARPVVLTPACFADYVYYSKTLADQLAIDLQEWVSPDFEVPEGCDPIEYTAEWKDATPTHTSTPGTYTYVVTPIANPNYAYSAASYTGTMAFSYLSGASAVLNPPTPERDNGWYTSVVTVAPAVGDIRAAGSTSSIAIEQLGIETFAPSIQLDDHVETQWVYHIRLNDDPWKGGRTATYSFTTKQDTVSPAILQSTNTNALLSVKAEDATSGIVKAVLEYRTRIDASGDDYWESTGRMEEIASTTGQVEFSFRVSTPRVYRIAVYDDAGHCTYSSVFTCTADSDRDGLYDDFELNVYTSASMNDTDGDGLSDGFEVHTSNTLPSKYDTDGDGANDSLEYFNRLDPRKSDTDGDGILDGDVIKLDVDPTKPEGDFVKIPSIASRMLGGYDFIGAQNLPPVEIALSAEAMAGDEEEGLVEAYSTEFTPSGYTKASSSSVNPMHIIHVDVANRILTEFANGYLVRYTYDEDGRVDQTEALLLPEEITDAPEIAFSISTDGSVILVAGWENGIAISDGLLINRETGESWRIYDIAGSSRFALAPDASELAYVSDGQVHTFSLTEASAADEKAAATPYTGTVFNYLADGTLVTEIPDGADLADGVYYIHQPTLEHAKALVVRNGHSVELEVNASFTQEGMKVVFQNAGKPVSNSLSLGSLTAKHQEAARAENARRAEAAQKDLQRGQKDK